MHVALAADNDFRARIERIKTRPGTILMVGQDEQIVVPLKRKGRAAQKSLTRRGSSFLASLPLALGLGMLAAVIFQALRFRLPPLSADLSSPDAEMVLGIAAGIVLSFVLAFVLAAILRLTSKGHLLVQAIGVTLMVASFHNLSHFLPGPMSLVFSPTYVHKTVATTQPLSLQFRGHVFLPFGHRDVPAGKFEMAPTADLPAGVAPKVRKAGKLIDG